MRTSIIPLAALVLLAAAAADDTSSSSSSSSSSSTATTGIPATYTHDIKVGENGLKMDPDTLTASPGDLINFHFYSTNHSVAESTFDKPCEPKENGIFSGFFAAGSGKDEASQVFSMRLNGTEPVWLYCAKDEHCKAGQVMVINAISGSDQNLKEYKEKAKKADPQVPANVNGGVVHDKPTTTSTSSSTSASATKKSGAAKVGNGASTVGFLTGVAGAMFML